MRYAHISGTNRRRIMILLPKYAENMSLSANNFVGCCRIIRSKIMICQLFSFPRFLIRNSVRPILFEVVNLEGSNDFFIDKLIYSAYFGGKMKFLRPLVTEIWPNFGFF